MVKASSFEKTSASVGKILAGAGKAIDFVIDRPKTTLGIGAGLLVGLPLLDWSRKRNVQNYQTQLLKQIAENAKSEKLTTSPQGFKKALPIVPPLR